MHQQKEEKFGRGGALSHQIVNEGFIIIVTTEVAVLTGEGEHLECVK